MKVVILAGGLGTRISEYTRSIPKPMIKICGKPIIHRIIDHYFKYGYSDFYIALGYKGAVIKKYFREKKLNKKIKIHLIETGKNTMTGGRLKRLKKSLNEPFLLTYGDGLSNINLTKLIKFHKKNKKLITLTAVRPPARFGVIEIKGKVVKYFREKNLLDTGWINGGFFVIQPEFLNLIKNDKTFLEQEPLQIATQKKQLLAFKHYGFWQCMDTLRDKKILEKKIREKKF